MNPEAAKSGRRRQGSMVPGTATPADLAYRLVFDRNPQPMWVYDVETLRFLAVNDAAIRRYGRTREEFLGMTIRDIEPPDEVLVDDLPFDGRAARLVVAVEITDSRLRGIGAYEEAVRRLSQAVERRDPATGGHHERIGEVAALLAEGMGLTEERVELLRAAAPMHDVGKIGVPDSVLLKQGELTDAERRMVRRHAELGHFLLSGSDAELLGLASEIALTHHERFNGSGYPRGLAREQIPIEGRIVAVADVLDALTSERVYRRAFSPEEALEIMKQGRWSEFDPAVIRVLVERWDDVRRALGVPTRR